MTTCTRCDAALTPDNAMPDTDYAFDNALWIGFYGGYGMFVDNLEAKLPVNTEDRWLRDADGEYRVYTDPTGQQHPIDNTSWEPEYREDRILDQPDYEAVLCHDCAHGLCDREPWLAKLLNPHGSHAHKTAWKNAHPDHYGWDYDMDKERAMKIDFDTSTVTLADRRFPAVGVICPPTRRRPRPRHRPRTDARRTRWPRHRPRARHRPGVHPL